MLIEYEKDEVAGDRLASGPQLEIGLVLAGQAAGALDVAGDDRGEDRLVALGDREHVDVRLEERLPRMDLDVQRLPHLEEEVVLGGAHDDAVEPDAVMEAGLDVAVAGRPFSRGVASRTAASSRAPRTV